MTGYNDNPLLSFFRCPEWFVESQFRVSLPPDLSAALASAQSSDPLWAHSREKWLTNSRLKEWVDLLRYEHYDQASTDTTVGAIALREAYYAIRPLLGVKIRRLLQGIALRGWAERPFPLWPVDRTVDRLLEHGLAGSITQKCVTEVPFIWFWPKGYSACALVTHDVETAKGLRFCPTLMDVDDAAGIKTSFQLVPEKRYQVSPEELEQFRARGFEINVHDLNHDGHLFRDQRKFRQRVQKINEYGQRFGAQGFRAGALYRNQDWYDGFAFEYDMSVPNVGHLDPQHGGCCTIFPYFIGNVLELPVTAIQDYSLFHVLHTYSTEVWRTQLSTIAKHYGLIHLIAHPDYLIEQQARDSYKALLEYLNELRMISAVWLTQPHEVNKWWRQRAGMKLNWDRDHWTVVGPGSERAAVAYFRMDGDSPRYQVEDRPLDSTMVSTNGSTTID